MPETLPPTSWGRPSNTIERGYGSGQLRNCKIKTSDSVWRFLLGFVVGVFATLTLTILVGWIIDTSTPHSGWLNKAFYGYALGCSSIGTGKDTS